MVVRKPRWGLSWRGRVVGCLVLVAVALAGLHTIYPFLAVTDRKASSVLVVEGWISDHAIGAGAEEFRSGGYTRVFTTGGPMAGRTGGRAAEETTAADYAAGILKSVGIPEASVQSVPSRVKARDRTFGSAVALRTWLREHHTNVSSLNIVTEAPHARRTRLLFQTAFGEAVEIGVVPVPLPDYDASRWWRFSEGVTDVISEGAAYVYARFFFHPTPGGGLLTED
jgi:DUF218 domain